MMHLALLKNLIVILNEIDFPENNQTHFSSVAGVHHTLRFPSESHCLNNHLGQPAVEQKKTLKMFLSDPSQIITLTCHSVIPCSCWFLFKSLDLSKLFNGVVKIDRHFGISRDASKNFNKRTCKHMILGQLRMWARQTKNAPLPSWCLTKMS